MVRVVRPPPVLRRGESLDDQVFQGRETDRAIRRLQGLGARQVARVGRLDEVEDDAQPLVQPDPTLADEAPREQHLVDVRASGIDHVDASGRVLPAGVEFNRRTSHHDELRLRCSEFRGQERGKPQPTLRRRWGP